MTEPNMVHVKFRVNIPEDIAAKMTEEHWFRLALLVDDAIKLVDPAGESRHYVSCWKESD